MSGSQPDQWSFPSVRRKVSVEELVRAKRVRPIQSMDELRADTFESDQEFDEFLAFTYAERCRDLG